MDDISHNLLLCGFVFGKRKNKIQSVVFGCILFTDGFSMVKKLLRETWRFTAWLSARQNCGH